LEHELLATAGGSPVRTQAFPVWPNYDEDEIAASVAILKSGKVNYWTGGEGVAFEKEFAAFVGCDHAVAVANGTVALELALHALGIGAGDEVLVTSRTFIASASCSVMRGAIPVVADVDTESQTVTAETLREKLSPRTKAIIAVHFVGWPCDMDPIMELAREFGLKVIEDCAQAHGATYKGRQVGSIGDAAAFSFCQDKIMTTAGEGGMLTTDSHDVWSRAWAFKDHGKNFDAIFNQPPQPRYHFKWIHGSFGTNWRLTELQSAIGRLQLGKLKHWLALRREHAETLTSCFLGLRGLRVTTPPEWIGHAYYKYYVFVRPEILRPDWSRDRIIEAINAEGIPCFSGGCSEIYLEKAFADRGWQPQERLANARLLGETSLMFLVHPTLLRNDIADTCRAVEKVMCQATIAAAGKNS